MAPTNISHNICKYLKQNGNLELRLHTCFIQSIWSKSLSTNWQTFTSAGLEAVSFSPYALYAYARSYEHYKHLTSMLKPYEGIVSESSIAGFLYYCHNHLRAARVKGCRTDWACTATPWLSHDWAARHTQSVQGSQLHTLRLIGCSLRTQPFIWLIDCMNAWCKPIKTHWKRLIAFTHFSRIGILTQLDSGQPAFQALHICWDWIVKGLIPGTWCGSFVTV